MRTAVRLPDRSWVRPPPTPRQLRIDVVIAVVAAVMSAGAIELGRSGMGVQLAGNAHLAFAGFAAMGAVLAFRRRLPVTTMLVVAVAFVALGNWQPQLAGLATTQVVMFVAIYAAWAWSNTPRLLIGSTAVVVVVMFGWLVWQFVHDTPRGQPSGGLLTPLTALIIYTVVINVAYFFGAIAWGHSAYRSARQRAEIAEAAERERASQERDRENAIRAERIRIARDLHDVVAHHVSGIGVQAAGAGRVFSRSPDTARQALGTIERSSREAVLQMHQLVGLLRDDSDGTDGRGPQPGLGDLHTLTQASGRPVVTFRQSGEPLDVPGTVQSSLFRVVQEAVTNVRRHAQASHATVVLRYLAEPDPAVEVEVTDDGHADVVGAHAVQSHDERETDHGTDHGGFGLSGIRERAAMHGGTCEIGPRPNGGFRVRVRVPLEEAS